MKGIVMENNEKNNLNELEQLKAQYETLKQQFDQQEIVNDRLMKSAIKNEVDFFARYRKSVMITYPIMAALLIAIYAWQGLTWPFGLAFLLAPNLSLLWFGGLALLLILAVVYELWLTRNVKRKVMENSDLLTLSKNMQKLKTGYAIYVGFLFLISYLLVSLVLINSDDMTQNIADINTQQYYNAIWYFVAVGVLLLVIFAMLYRNFVGHCNNVIQHIDAIEGKTSSRIDKPFKVYLYTMVVAFGACFCLFYSMVCPSVYERAAGDMSTEGKLAIWKYYSDTLVPTNDVAAVMNWWQHNDSMVVMKEKWVEDGRQRIYALKKTTPEGPAISSAVIGGKPLIQKIVHESYREATPMSVHMTPEAAKLWLGLTKKAEQTGPFRCVLSYDGVVYQDWKVMCGIPGGSFFIMKHWSSKRDFKNFCKHLINN
jgi:hypothetical protein